MDTPDKTEPGIYLNVYTSSWLHQGFGVSQRKHTQLSPIPAHLTACTMLLGTLILV